MAIAPIPSVTGTGVFLPGADIDTDEIIPARFLKCVTFDGLGDAAFADVRYNEDGSPKPNYPLNKPQYQDATILVAGINFGCGSSREHAPQAIYRAGFRAIIAESFAEIFFGNSTNLGLPCVCADAVEIRNLAATIEADPTTEIVVDLENKEVRFGSESFAVSIPDSARSALVRGRYDQLGELLEEEDQVEAVASKLPYFAGE
ncbi:3-isopropylmalate dehydratase small subunit [Sulfuriroseicoccus oceanibius]|uniref:3-isopropylmalate dehydratase n=1 Tax=Sulfuriroseicoccus oceanibius TaxID=2707525 RepID=A0A6B3LF73_9BACT|nr:3-isopropylmalate dehydratase small subunit [Sulfuriroseicoccus oceanibius]QQL45000.1 3-isopropylmalate dehydratase small subunit [Sulfuriroseicoccus oceanibius]